MGHEQNGDSGYKLAAHPHEIPAWTKRQSWRPTEATAKLLFRLQAAAGLGDAAPGKDKHGSKLQALVRTLVTSAIAGNMRAQALLVGALARVAEVDEQGPNLMTPDDHAAPRRLCRR